MIFDPSRTRTQVLGSCEPRNQERTDDAVKESTQETVGSTVGTRSRSTACVGTRTVRSQPKRYMCFQEWDREVVEM